MLTDSELVNKQGQVNASLVNLMDQTSSIIGQNPNIFEAIDYPYIASMMERMRNDENSNTQKMTVFGTIM
jgi:hypothetical protein